MCLKMMSSLIAVLLSFCVVFNPGNIDITLGDLQGEGNSNSRTLGKLICYLIKSFCHKSMMHDQFVEMKKWFSLTIVR
jgi:hypothetical protein